jgi:hypothetical protein
LAVFTARDRVRALSLFLSLARDLARDLDLDFSLSRNLDLYLDLARALSLARDLDRARIFSSVNFDELVSALEALRNQILANSEHEEEMLFKEKISNIWFSALGIEAETTQPSPKDSQALADYFYACKLMIRCKENAVRVSPEVWAGIESRIFTVPTANEANCVSPQ